MGVVVCLQGTLAIYNQSPQTAQSLLLQTPFNRVFGKLKPTKLSKQKNTQNRSVM